MGVHLLVPSRVSRLVHAVSETIVLLVLSAITLILIQLKVVVSWRHSRSMDQVLLGLCFSLAPRLSPIFIFSLPFLDNRP